MLYFDTIDVSEGIGVNNISDYWYFLNYSFNFQQNVCNRCHGLLVMSINDIGIPILKIKGSDNGCIISFFSKNEAINLMQNADLTEKRVIL